MSVAYRDISYNTIAGGAVHWQFSAEQLLVMCAADCHAQSPAYRPVPHTHAPTNPLYMSVCTTSLWLLNPFRVLLFVISVTISAVFSALSWIFCTRLGFGHQVRKLQSQENREFNCSGRRRDSKCLHIKKKKWKRNAIGKVNNFCCCLAFCLIAIDSFMANSMVSR